MKKILAILLMCLCGFTIIGGGVAMSLVEDKTQAAQNDEFLGAETDDSQTENENGETTDSENSGDSQITPYGCYYDVYIKNVVYQSATGYTASKSTTSSAIASNGGFTAEWLESATKKSDWGSPGPTVAGGKYSGSMGQTFYDDDPSLATATYTGGTYSYFYYHEDQSANIFWYPKRFIRVKHSMYRLSTGNTYTMIAVNGNYFMGVSKSKTGGNSTYSDSTYYLYGKSGSVTTSSSTANNGAGTDLNGTFYVIWRKSSYLTFNANNGSGSVPAGMTVYAGLTASIPSTKPTRTGYTFKGWGTSASATSTVVAAGGTLSTSYTSSSRTLYAVWSANTYTISFDAGEGSGSMSSKTATFRDTKDSSYDSNWTSFYNTGFSKTGYHFVGWKVSGCTSGITHFYGTSKTSYSTTTSTGFTHNLTGTGYYRNLRSSSGTVTFEALWEKNIYTLTIEVAYSKTTIPPQLSFYEIIDLSDIVIDPPVIGPVYPTATGSGNTIEQNATVLPSVRVSPITVRGPYKHLAGTSNYSVSYEYDTTYSPFVRTICVVPGPVTVLAKQARFVGTTNDRTYYFKEDTAPTSSSYTYMYTPTSLIGSTGKLVIGPGYTHNWTPNSDATIYLHFLERFSVTYNKNGGTGTLPPTQYFTYGGSVSLGTNSLTKSYYTADGWNTDIYGTEKTKYANGSRYSRDNDVTLYADWSPITATVKVQLMTSTNGFSYTASDAGGSVSVQYYRDSNNSATTSTQSITTSTLTTLSYKPFTNRSITFTGTPNSGYTFIGISTSNNYSSSSRVTTYTPTMRNETYTIYVFFKKTVENVLKYDSTGQYWYFEDGEYPQTYVGTTMNTTLTNANPSQTGSITYFDGTSNQTISIHTYNRVDYAKVRATSTKSLKMSDGTTYSFTSGTYYWFKVEPIRWRVSDYGVSSTSYPSGWSVYGSYKENFTVVSDQVLMVGAVASSGWGENWAFTNSQLYSNMSSVSDAVNSSYFANTTNTYYKYGTAGNQNKVVSVNNTADNAIRVASVDEIEENYKNTNATASDMVCLLLGCNSEDYAKYWTRNLGSMGNGITISAGGDITNSLLSDVNGVRFAMTMRNGIRY